MTFNALLPTFYEMDCMLRRVYSKYSMLYDFYEKHTFTPRIVEPPTDINPMA